MGMDPVRHGCEKYARKRNHPTRGAPYEMLIDTAVIVKESLSGVCLAPLQPAPKSRIKLSSEQRTRLEFLLKKLRIFGESNHYHNAAFIEGLLAAGEDRRAQFSPSSDCVEVVENILSAADERAYRNEEQPKASRRQVLSVKEALASD
jgi:hypothetical protein